MKNKPMLYLECKSGISGDMTVAALLDIGADREKLLKSLNSLKLEGVSFKISEVSNHGIRACDFDVILSESEHSHHHHDDAHEHHYNHEHGDEHDHHHHHEHSHDHRYQHHEHEHRNLHDVYAVIERGDLMPWAKELAKKIFMIVASAESKVHGKPIEEVHFHEVGAVDSIVDIVAAAVCIDDLGIEDVIVSSLTEGSGFVTCQHGTLPVPVPAVSEIAVEHKIPLKITDVGGEMVTPTGIAIAAALRTQDKLPNNFTVSKIGYGSGKRDFGNPNVLRAMLIEPVPEESTDKDSVWMLETNIDDCTGEQLGLAMEVLFEKGAKDVHYIPSFMKKNRPGWLLRVLTDEALLPLIEETIFRSTTTIGIRKYPIERTCLIRETIETVLPFGTVQVKKCKFQDTVFYYPEYESVKQVAEKSGMDFRTVFEESQKQAEKEGK